MQALWKEGFQAHPHPTWVGHGTSELQAVTKTNLPTGTLRSKVPLIPLTCAENKDRLVLNKEKSKWKTGTQTSCLHFLFFFLKQIGFCSDWWLAFTIIQILNIQKNYCCIKCDWGSFTSWLISNQLPGSILNTQCLKWDIKPARGKCNFVLFFLFPFKRGGHAGDKMGITTVEKNAKWQTKLQLSSTL